MLSPLYQEQGKNALTILIQQTMGTPHQQQNTRKGDKRHVDQKVRKLPISRWHDVPQRKSQNAENLSELVSEFNKFTG